MLNSIWDFQIFYFVSWRSNTVVKVLVLHLCHLGLIHGFQMILWASQEWSQCAETELSYEHCWTSLPPTCPPKKTTKNLYYEITFRIVTIYLIDHMLIICRLFLKMIIKNIDKFFSFCNMTLLIYKYNAACPFLKYIAISYNGSKIHKATDKVTSKKI